MAVIDSAVALGALPGLDAEEPVLDLSDLSPNLAQAVLQAKLSALAAMHSTTGYDHAEDVGNKCHSWPVSVLSAGCVVHVQFAVMEL